MQVKDLNEHSQSPESSWTSVDPVAVRASVKKLHARGELTSRKRTSTGDTATFTYDILLVGLSLFLAYEDFAAINLSGCPNPPFVATGTEQPKLAWAGTT